ncbi:N-acetylmuramoyl-L-alanine amidase [Microcebus murinus]|uniref:N-acetylmuramoyl-L-alanine amidase n=1 Tax=Microcebus murinus TaxID=30608 RepID=UPI003F6D3D9B
MSPAGCRPAMTVQGVLWVLLGLLLRPEPGTASLPLTMDSVVRVLEELEQKAPATERSLSAPAWVLSLGSNGSQHDFYCSLLGPESFCATAELGPSPLSPELQGLAEAVAQYGAWDENPYGVVLTPDGSTVAVEPLLAGLEAGLQGRRAVNLTLGGTAAPPDLVGAPAPDVTAPSPGGLGGASPGASPAGAGAPDCPAASPGAGAGPPATVDSLLAVTLARTLGLGFLYGPQNWSRPGLGTEGCWDKLSNPRLFTALDPRAPLLSVAFLNGALDGFLLGDYLSQAPEPRAPLSSLLRQYYGPAGVSGDPGLRSNFRRQKGTALISAATLAPQVWGVLALMQKLRPIHSTLRDMTQEQLARLASRAAKEFTEDFLGCPAIHPRCLWEAAPYRGSPKPLQLPLEFLYVHHTYEPAQPCTDFARCAADMRSMQRFHQDGNGWEDIGYSFVVGSDGYVYEGRGWHWVGAHTLGHNQLGFGVAIVGNYTAALPSEAALRTVRDELPSCAVRAGLLRPHYAALGHRQLVRTHCPGDALFRRLSTWPHFRAIVKPRTARRTSERSRREPPALAPAATEPQ